MVVVEQQDHLATEFGCDRLASFLDRYGLGVFGDSGGAQHVEGVDLDRPSSDGHAEVVLRKTRNGSVLAVHDQRFDQDQVDLDVLGRPGVCRLVGRLLSHGRHLQQHEQSQYGQDRASSHRNPLHR